MTKRRKMYQFGFLCRVYFWVTVKTSCATICLTHGYVNEIHLTLLEGFAKYVGSPAGITVLVWVFMPCLFLGDCYDLLGYLMPKSYLSILKIC